MSLVLAVSLSAAAQDAPKAEVFGGYSYLRGNPGLGAPGINLNGGSGSISYNLSSAVGIVADVGGYHFSNGYGSGIGGNVISYLFGPKFVYRSSGKVEPFAQALFGGARLSVAGFSNNAFAMALGGGVDVKATEHVAIRLIQAEYVMTRFNIVGVATDQNNARISAGIVFRFGGK
ncbi:MAG: hypothetical protein LAN18_09275 [Acidobacteriia bacterium]|nr:hypothetical protein [Terriglobia bacterium]